MRLAPQLLHENEFHRSFVVIGIVLGIAGGFSLALALSVDAASGFSLGPRWAALAQTHGHLQTVGFLGLIIIGVALRVAPRFASARLRHPCLIPLILAALVVGVLLRAAGQSLAEHQALAAIMAAGAWLEAIGSLIFAWLLIGSTFGALRRGNVPVLFLASGAVWLAVQAILGAVWLSDLAITDGSVLPASKNAVLLLIQIFGFHLSFLLGITVHALPTFFNHRSPGRREALTAWASFQIGLTVTAITFAWWATEGERLWRTENAGLLVLAAGMLLAVGLTRAWGAPSKLRPATQPIGRLPQLALGWLVVDAALLAYFAIHSYAERRPIAVVEFDSVRHLLALGVLSIAIAGMAHIILPEFGIERLARRGRVRRAWLFGVGLSVVAATRAAPGVSSAGLPSTSDYWHMAAAAGLALLLIAWLGWLFLRAIRNQPALLADVSIQVAARRGDQLAVEPRPAAAASPEIIPIGDIGVDETRRTPRPTPVDP